MKTIHYLEHDKNQYVPMTKGDLIGTQIMAKLKGIPLEEYQNVVHIQEEHQDHTPGTHIPYAEVLQEE